MQEIAKTDSFFKKTTTPLCVLSQRVFLEKKDIQWIVKDCIISSAQFGLIAVERKGGGGLDWMISEGPFQLLLVYVSRIRNIS